MKNIDLFYKSGKSLGNYCKKCYNIRRKEHRDKYPHPKKKTSFEKLPADLQTAIIKDLNNGMPVTKVYYKYKPIYGQLNLNTLQSWKRTGKIPGLTIISEDPDPYLPTKMFYGFFEKVPSGSPSRVSPSRVSPRKVSPRKVSPAEVAVRLPPEEVSKILRPIRANSPKINKDLALSMLHREVWAKIQKAS